MQVIAPTKKQTEKLVKAGKDPFWFLPSVLGVNVWEGQERIINAIVEQQDKAIKRVTVKSGHALGKDYLASALSLWFLYNFRPSIVLTTAPTDRQVQKIIWGEINAMHKNAKIPLGGKINTEEIKIEEKWYAAGFTTKETKGQVGKLQGFHSPNMLIIVSEAQAVEDIIYEQIEGIATSGNVIILYIGNPLTSTGAYFKSFSDSSFKKITLSCYESPNYIAGKEIVPGLVTKAWVDDKEKKWGKGTPVFDARVEGEFPDMSQNTLVSLPQLLKCVGEPVQRKGFTALGIDVARYGDDETVLTQVQGTEQIAYKVFSGIATTATRDEAIMYSREIKPHGIIVDDAGVGGGVTDMLAESKKEGLLSAKVIEGIIVGGKPKEGRKYYDLRSELFWRIRELVIATAERKEGEPKKISILNDEDLLSQLSSMRFSFPKGKIKVESKEEMKKRNVQSPDRADALMIALYGSTFKYEVPPPSIKKNTEAYFEAIRPEENEGGPSWG